MKTSLRKLRGLALHKHEAKDHRIDLQPLAQLDELAQTSQVRRVFHLLRKTSQLCELLVLQVRSVLLSLNSIFTVRRCRDLNPGVLTAAESVR